MAFDLSGLSSIITAVGNGASSVIAATKGNVKSTTTSVGVNTGVNSPTTGSSQLTGILLIGGIVLLAAKIFKRKH
ncbi:MAG: hypothetical protein J0I84_00075 [Terrimonas sp.]|nr:hypothetical protein [Terrimonas sp.]OJY90617.1 MAG: hypothetical protein BGP13_19525 [Sphingobacteriales bacterium 40-81]